MWGTFVQELGPEASPPTKVSHMSCSSSCTGPHLLQQVPCMCWAQELVPLFSTVSQLFPTVYLSAATNHFPGPAPLTLEQQMEF